MLRAGQDCPLKLTIPNEVVQDLRTDLHEEEAVKELILAFQAKQLHLVLDSVADSLVVVFGTAIACGFTYEQVEAGIAEAMRSNMTKFIDGKRASNGKWEKGPSYTPANFQQIIKHEHNRTSS